MAARPLLAACRHSRAVPDSLLHRRNHASSTARHGPSTLDAALRRDDLALGDGTHAWAWPVAACGFWSFFFFLRSDLRQNKGETDRRKASRRRRPRMNVDSRKSRGTNSTPTWRKLRRLKKDPRAAAARARRRRATRRRAVSRPAGRRPQTSKSGRGRASQCSTARSVVVRDRLMPPGRRGAA